MSSRARTTSHDSSPDRIRLVVQAFLGSRLAMVLVGALVMWKTGRTFIDVAANWDVQHFLDIARNGYTKPTDPAFFPGWPLLLRALGGLGVPEVLGGTILSVLLSIAAAAALWRLGGPRLGPWAAGLWLLAPTAIFTAVPYTESLFCALAFWAWERAKASQWWAMAILAALACTVRVSGLFLVGALAVLILTRPRTGKKHTGPRPSMAPLAWLLLPLLTLALYAHYHYERTGDWLAWYHAQTSGWARALPKDQPFLLTLVMAPWTSFMNTVPVILPGAYADHPGWAWVFRAEVVSMVVGMIATIVLLIRRRWAEASWIGVQVYAFCLSYWWMSVNRAVLLWFPLWLLLAEWASWRPSNASVRGVHKMLVGIFVTVSFLVSLAWSALFYLGMWAS